MDRSEKRTWLAIQTLHGLAPDILIGGTDIEQRLSLRISQPEDLMDVPGDLPEELFALTQVRSLLQDSFTERAIPPHQNRDEKRCRDKYGADWDRYLAIVPKRFVPFVY